MTSWLLSVSTGFAEGGRLRDVPPAPSEYHVNGIHREQRRRRSWCRRVARGWQASHRATSSAAGALSAQDEPSVRSLARMQRASCWRPTRTGLMALTRQANPAVRPQAHFALGRLFRVSPVGVA